MEPKLTDFNISKAAPLRNTTATKTRVMGSGGYRAPEVLKAQDDGKTKYGKPCHIWSVGVLSFCMKTKRMFASEQEVLMGITDISGKIQDVQDDKLEEFLTLCLQIDPRERETCGGLLSHRFLLD
jgi:serine/threonine protein kinase